MQYITTTQLRTKSSELVDLLLAGGGVNLIHRSKIIGEIKPKISGKFFNAKRMAEIVKKLNLKPLNPNEIEERYRDYMMKRHGKGVS